MSPGEMKRRMKEAGGGVGGGVRVRIGVGGREVCLEGGAVEWVEVGGRMVV